ncbi:NHL repeat-containing protein [Sunxiuqinia indica]|uniref:hypothetical protein n=1 Tax=Sunxiuqinia indica TaxID=2692584 RepID=UPI0013581C6E|nr:hypothetical protein [Sunxiuqinia indica]
MHLKTTLLSILLTTMLQANSQNLSLVWETDIVMAKPESAIFDRENQLIYVSNVNGNYCTKDGNGFISKVGLDGKIVELKWIGGLNSPQGLALDGNKLFVADVDEVVEINITTGEILKQLKIDNAIFLNDAVADKSGNVFISDCKGNKIYRLANDSVSVWCDDPLLKGANGLLCVEPSLLVLNMGNATIYSVNKTTRSLTEFCSGIENCDGIVSDGRNGFFVSGAWQGEIWHLDSSGVKSLALDLGPEKVIAADIEFIPEENLLLVPTLNKTLRAYRWGEQ